MEEKEKRVRALTKLYYSNPKVQAYLLDFAAGREVVPRYFEGFGKRPDTLQYLSDIMGLVQKGATSFHGSEELWADPLHLSSDMTIEMMHALRTGWDLLIDIDSPFLDFSKIAARLLIQELESFGIREFGIKFSGSKGFHIIVPRSCFPSEFEGKETSKMFPEWPRAICSYLMERIKPAFAKEAHMISNLEALELRTNKKREELIETVCPQCGKPVTQDKWITLHCEHCSNEIRQKKSGIAKKRVLRCENCLSIMTTAHEEDFFECADCKLTNISKLTSDDARTVTYTREASKENIAAMSTGLQEKYTGGFDLVLVAPRHLFRMPYSLHEKTSLASVVITKEQIARFTPRDADPLRIELNPFLPSLGKGGAKVLLAQALSWQREREALEEQQEKHRYAKSSWSGEADFDFSGVTETMFPPAIKKLLKGVSDGKKRGLFILITFLRSLSFSPEYIHTMVREWNKRNEQPLKEGYIKSQLDWHFRQKKKILPPNYENAAFYKDLNLLESKPQSKNPVVDVMRSLRKGR